MQPLEKYVVPKREQGEPIKDVLLSETEYRLIQWYRSQQGTTKIATHGWMKTKQLGFLRPFFWQLATLLKLIKK
jgi:hypothetical protein